MNKLFSIVILCFVALFSLPSRVMAAPNSDDKVVMGGSYVLEAGETLPGNLIVIGGNATIEEGATVNGDVILLGGQVSISGLISGNLNLFGGSASLRDTAIVNGNAVVTSSVLNRSDGATIKGKVTEGNELPKDLSCRIRSLPTHRLRKPRIPVFWVSSGMFSPSSLPASPQQSLPCLQLCSLLSPCVVRQQH